MAFTEPVFPVGLQPGKNPHGWFVGKSFNWPEPGFRQISVLQPTASRGRATPVSYVLYLRLSFCRPSNGFFAVAAIPAARSFAIRAMSFNGTGLVSGKWTVPFRSS